MTIIKNKGTRALIYIMCALVLLGLLIAKKYYSSVNSSIDPRIVPARKLYEKYNHYAQQNDFDSVLYLMDTIEAIYNQYEHYNKSFEVGVLYNNRAACYLTKTLYCTDSSQKESNLNLAEQTVKKSISIYINWKEKYISANPDSLKLSIETDFSIEDNAFSVDEAERFLSNRISEIKEAQKDINRRLSVSYTNLGLVFRQRELYDSAATNYIKALELWDQNLTAENNLNILLGKPLRKRNIIQKLFPPKND